MSANLQAADALGVQLAGAPVLDVAQRAEPFVASPCTGVCQLQSSSGYCQGCLRSLDEIAAWGQADDAYKRAILAQLAQRTLTP